MAAITAGMRTGLRAIGFTIAASDEILDEQGYDSLTALAELTDQTCADLVTLIRRPGGTIANPVLPAAGDPLLPPIANPGIKVGHRALTNLKTAAFVACHIVHTSQPIDSPATVLTPATLASLHGLKEAEDAYAHPPAIPMLDKIERIRGHIEEIDAQLLKTLGMAKTPLAFVVRESEHVLAHNLDPSNGYNTVQEEMVAPMPHTHPAYREDNIAVWDIIHVHATEAFSWINRCERRRDGRTAYLALTSHYLGDAKNEALRNAADHKILNMFYGGEKNRFNWTRYVSVHKECHNDLEATGTAMPEDDKVRRLLMGIHTPSLQTAVLFVRSSAALRHNFDAAVDSITTVVETIKDTNKRPFSQVSGVNVDEDDSDLPLACDDRVGGHHHRGRGGRCGRGYQGRGYQGSGCGYQGRGRGRGRGGGQAAASRGLNQSLLDGIRDTSSPACPTNNGTKCAKYAMDAKLDLSVPATTPVIMVAITDMAMGTTTHHHKAILQPSTSNHTHHHHLPLIKLALFTSTPLATWTTQLSIVSPMVHPASDMSCHTTSGQWWVVYNMTCPASCPDPN
jgi:hypothetical protein